MILLSNFERDGFPNANENPKRVIEIKPFYVNNEHEEKAVPDFSKERSMLIEEANHQAKAIIKQAKDQKQQIMLEASNWQQQWEQEKERLQLEAYEQAFQQGAQEGREAGYQETRALIDEARSIVNSSKVEYEKNVERSERTIVELAIICAEKILRSELQKDDESFIGIVRSALKEVRNQKEVQIHVHPGRYELVISQKDEIEALFPSEINCYIFPNEEADENTCFIETSNGRIDAGIDTQLHQLRKTLLQLLESE
ncbi:flagellar assembly protein FliH [Domibacillus iocasae]|uniref:Flagellar assembly protein FliH n=1 Tax=Domibacillus iocasae TaxID=1714016 RepID=A0A1E7DKM9_9BACI|nr:flagellar assembly protein FliH [Domibacillus iocasae]